MRKYGFKASIPGTFAIKVKVPEKENEIEVG